ncbi:MAG: response regulator transcription factor [Williamsia sp.]|nr:response regulator transcription factor [Williamsia sp.]
MIKAIIVDDEQHCLDRLSNLLAAHCAEAIYVMGTYRSVVEGVEAIGKLRPELIFLDVELRNQTAFDLLEKVKETSKQINFDIIFTTAHAEYAVQAFKLNAIDYLMKRIDPEDLIAAVEKLTRKKSQEERTRQLEAVTEYFKSPPGVLKRIAVPTSTGLTVLSLSDIIRCESCGSYTRFHIRDKPKESKTLMVAKTLGDYEELLSAYSFFRVHNSDLINLAFVKDYNKGKGGFVIMTDGSKIDVSTRRKNEFLKKLSEG